ncbi:MAG: LacI family transcriptional regulator [Bacteroidetes bacterium]|nr:MAG: LacI family transcriptional regulator [Bacteroidota bacterium]
MKVDERMVVEGDFTIASGITCTNRLLDEVTGVDAIFAVCDAAAFGAMKVLKERGIKIPDEISVAGFTNEPMADLVEPALTTVKQPIYEIGETAAKLLFAQLNDPELPAELCVLDTLIEIRESTRKSV